MGSLPLLTKNAGAQGIAMHCGTCQSSVHAEMLLIGKYVQDLHYLSALSHGDWDAKLHPDEGIG
jgi:hypothetical protein